MSTMTKEPSESELMALAIVDMYVDGSTCWHDDGNGAPGKHDFEIHYRDGRVGAVEVTSAEDQTLAGRYGALRKRQTLTDDRLRLGWHVMLADEVILKTAAVEIPRLLSQLERANIFEVDALSTGCASADDDANEWARRSLADLHADSALAVDWLDPGTVVLAPPGLPRGAVNRDPNEFVSFVDEFIHSRPSDVEKLGRSGADERHLFVWGGIFSTARPQLRALAHNELSLPTRAPILLDGVTHVWVAVGPGPARPSRVIAWYPGRGWVTAGHTPYGGPLPAPPMC